jgi:hypothetical protein
MAIPGGSSGSALLLPVSTASPKNNEGKHGGIKPSLWNTWEFYAYYVVLGILVLRLTLAAYRFSSGRFQYEESALIV